MTTQPQPFAAEILDAAKFFARRLDVETDASDVFSAQAAGAEVVLIDVRSAQAWAQGHIPGAVHMPYREIAELAPALWPAGMEVVVYCWSPGCNAGVKGALALSLAGFRAKEMIGGFEYWVREGYPVEDARGTHRRDPDPLTGVAKAR